MRSWPIRLTILLSGCGSSDRSPPRPPANEPVNIPDSLVATAPGGVEIWFTLVRPGKSVEGVPCVDRALEIRKGNTRIPVPLLYTATPPEVVNDTTVRARLSDRCRPGDSYLVDLRSGRPVRER